MDKRSQVGVWMGTIKIWNLDMDLPIRILTGHRSNIYYSVCFSPDGQTLASGSADDTIRLWDVGTGTLVRTLTGHTESVYSVSFKSRWGDARQWGWRRRGASMGCEHR